MTLDFNEVIRAEEQAVKKADALLKDELNGYWDCSSCGQVFRYEDYKDKLYHLDELYKGLIDMHRTQGDSAMRDLYDKAQPIPEALSYEHRHGGYDDGTVLFSRIEADVRNIPLHKHIELRRALQHSRILVDARAGRIRARGEARINAFLSKNAD